MSKESESMSALRQARREAGLCIRCGNKARPLRTECQKCADVQQKRNETYRNQSRLRRAGMTPRPTPFRVESVEEHTPDEQVTCQE